MNGRNNMELRVGVEPPGSSSTTIWSLSGDNGNKWLQAQMPLPAFLQNVSNFQVSHSLTLTSWTVVFCCDQVVDWSI